MSQNRMIRWMFKVAARATLPVFFVAAGAALPVVAGTTLVDGVLTFDTSDGDILYTDPIGADVTKIVKTGAGLAHVETGNHVTNAFSGTIEVQAGTLCRRARRSTCRVTPRGARASRAETLGSSAGRS